MAQVNKISSFKSFTEIKNQETTMKLREENNAKRQETVGKIGAILDEMGLTSLSELEEDKKQALISKMFSNVSEDEAEDIEDEINKLGEPKKLKEGNAFGAAVKKAKDAGETEFEFDGKTYKVEESKVNEGQHGMAKKLLNSVIDGDTSRAEGVKMSKELAQHYLYWITTSPYGKKNENLPLEMLVKASFNWGIERQLPTTLKKELATLKDSVKESVESIDEARSITKIQNEWSKVTTEMAALAAEWKAAEGDAKTALLAQMKEKTSVKKGLESELDAAVAGKDKDLELVVSEAFYRLPKDVIGNELYLASQNLTNLYNSSAVGNDIDAGVIDSIIKKLNTIKKSIKKFNSAEEVAGTVYEAATKQFDVDFNDMVKNIKAGYGWIDPEYVGDTWENSSDSIDYSLVKGEILKRLFNAGLLVHADENDEEVAGKKVKFSELGAYVMAKESLVNEAEIKSDDEFKEYAMTVLKKAFGDDFDEAKGEEVADGILKKCDGDYGACVGMLTSSLGESVVADTEDNDEIDAKDIDDSDEDNDDSSDDEDEDDNDDDELDEAFDANYWEDYHNDDSGKLENPNNIQIQQEVEACAEEWNDNNENGEENEIKPATEKKVIKSAKEFVKAKGWISSDVIEAMLAQES